MTAAAARPVVRYERQEPVPNGEATPVEFDLAPDPARFARAPHVGRGYRPSGAAYVMGAVLYAGGVRPVYTVGTQIHLVCHTEPGEDLTPYGARLSADGHVLWTLDEFHARCRIGLAWCVRPVSEAAQAAPPHPDAPGGGASTAGPATARPNPDGPPV